MLGNINLYKFLVTEKCIFGIEVFFLSLGFSDKDLEDVLGGGDYKPDKGRGRSIYLFKQLILIYNMIT